jgi:osmoprotectant transport system substrate-binding protein
MWCRFNRTASLLLFIVLALSLVACAPMQVSAKGQVTVGSKIDTEGSLLAQVIILILRDRGFTVLDKSGTGPTSIVRKALISGEIDIYPEYTGNGAFFFNDTTPDTWNNAGKGYQKVKELDKAANNIVWLAPAPANNTWAIAVTRALADKAKLKTLDDFASYVNGGGQVKLIGSQEFISSPVALPAFQKIYGFTLASNQIIAVASGDTAQTEKAASLGTDGVNAAMAYGTDGGLNAFGLVILEDPRGAQPVYEPAPIMRGVVLDKYPEISVILDPVFKSLDTVTLQALNARIAVEGKAAAAVARDYLVSKGFLK